MQSDITRQYQTQIIHNKTPHIIINELKIEKVINLCSPLIFLWLSLGFSIPYLTVSNCIIFFTNKKWKSEVCVAQKSYRHQFCVKFFFSILVAFHKVSKLYKKIFLLIIIALHWFYMQIRFFLYLSTTNHTLTHVPRKAKNRRTEWI